MTLKGHFSLRSMCHHIVWY